MWHRRLILACLVLLVLATVAAGVLAAYLWKDDRTGSLASATVMATFALAAVALLTLWQNEKLVQQNADLVKAAIAEATATTEQATASRDQATASRETVEEMRREREWAYKPALVIRLDSRSEGVIGHEFMVPVLVVSNIGTGPAFDVRFAAHRMSEQQEHEWMSAEWRGLPAGGEVVVGLNKWGTPEKRNESRRDRYRCIVDEWSNRGEEAYAVRYDDWFGTHYRAGGPYDHPTDEYRGHPSLKDAPDWLRCN